MVQRFSFLDSHTAGEPTRLIFAGLPDLGSGSVAEQCRRFQTEHDALRRLLVDEPRGGEALVGAALCPPADSASAAGVIFFNKTGFLGMCGHGLIGVAVSLKALQRLETGIHQIETPVGNVQVELHDAHRVTIQNVPSSPWGAPVTVEVPGQGSFTGRLAYGGNWFFITETPPCPLERPHLPTLTAWGQAISESLWQAQITGPAGEMIDHIACFGPSVTPGTNSRNFVSCPSGAYDRSPCGTGTSAWLSLLAEAGRLAPGDVWVQESLTGGRFTARYQLSSSGQILPEITGQAFLCAQGELLFESADPLV